MLHCTPTRSTLTLISFTLSHIELLFWMRLCMHWFLLHPYYFKFRHEIINFFIWSIPCCPHGIFHYSKGTCPTILMTFFSFSWSISYCPHNISIILKVHTLPLKWNFLSFLDSIPYYPHGIPFIFNVHSLFPSWHLPPFWWFILCCPYGTPIIFSHSPHIFAFKAYPIP